MNNSEHRPILIVIAGPNGSGNSVDNAEARLLFRLSGGKLIKLYTDEIPEWAQIMLPNQSF